MSDLSFTQILSSNHWTELSTPPFAENVGKGADTYFTYQNKKDNTLTVSIFSKDKKIRFRVFNIKTKEVAWLEIAIDSAVNTVISKIVEEQENITQADAFGFYFSISGLGEVAILAWEQYEDDYR